MSDIDDNDSDDVEDSSSTKFSYDPSVDLATNIINYIKVTRPGIVSYTDIVRSSVFKFGKVDTNKLKIAIEGSPRKSGYQNTILQFIFDELVLVVPYASPVIDNIMEDYKTKVLDWNQRRKLRSKIVFMVGSNFLRTGNYKLEDRSSGDKSSWLYSSEDIDRFISHNLPFASVDTSKIPNYTDYRLKSNLHDLVNRNLLVRALAGDTDHYHDCNVGAQYLNLDDEQKVWYALNFGFTYRAQWASLALQLFKYPHTEKIEDIAEWCGKKYNPSTGKFDKSGTGNMNLIVVGKDCKYSKSKYPEFFLSVQKFSEGGNLYNKLKAAATKYDDPNKNYKLLDWTIRQNFAGLGRFMSFLVMQQLYSFFNWPINGYLCGLEEEGTWSCRIGQVAVMVGLDHDTEANIIQGAGKYPSKELVVKMEEHTKTLLSELNTNLPFDTDVFEYESVQCEILDKYLLKSREFSFWTSTEKSELISHVYRNWTKNYKPTAAYPTCPDLKVLFLSQISKRPGFICSGWLDDKWMNTLNHLGIPSFHNYMLTDEVDIVSSIGVGSPEKIVNKEMSELVNSLFSSEEICNIKTKYDPRLYLRWKKNIDKTSKYYQILNNDEKQFIESLDTLEASGLLYHNRV